MCFDHIFWCLRLFARCLVIFLVYCFLFCFVFLCFVLFLSFGRGTSSYYRIYLVRGLLVEKMSHTNQRLNRSVSFTLVFCLQEERCRCHVKKNDTWAPLKQVAVTVSPVYCGAGADRKRWRDTFDLRKGYVSGHDCCERLSYSVSLLSSGRLN